MTSTKTEPLAPVYPGQRGYALAVFAAASRKLPDDAPMEAAFAAIDAEIGLALLAERERCAAAVTAVGCRNAPELAAIIRASEEEGPVPPLIRRAVTAERERGLADLAKLAATFNGSGEGDIFARVILEHARVALLTGQAERAGVCGKGQECGGGCSLPDAHSGPCSCTIDGSECPA